MFPDVKKWPWWEAANERRQQLILARHNPASRGMTTEEALELSVLQDLADLIMDVVDQKAAPFRQDVLTKGPMNSRQLAEELWKTVENAYTYAHEEHAGPEPEDKEGALQEIEGILERHGDVPPDLNLKAERAKNETYFP